MTDYISNEAIIIGIVLIFSVVHLAMNVADYAVEGKHISTFLTFVTCLWIGFSYLIIFGYAKNPFL